MNRDRLIKMGVQSEIIKWAPSSIQQNMKAEKKRVLSLTYLHYSDKHAFSTNNYYFKYNYERSGTNF